MKKRILTSVFFIFTVVLSASILAQSNQYLHFDGQDDYTELPNAAGFINNSTTISMAGWFNTDELLYGQGMMSIRGGGSGTGEMYLIQLNNGTIECRLVTTTGLHEVVAPAGSIVAGTWQHIAWVFDETTVELFIDGVSIGSSTASGIFQSPDKPFTIGKCVLAGFNFVYKGGADEVSLWSKALTQAEIQDMITNELDGTETGLEVYYKFNQGTPEGNNTGISLLLDESGDSDKHSNLLNFALTGTTSNFLGELGSGEQAINFPQIENKLVSDPPLELEASSNSGLPITYEIVSGPATVSGSTLTLTGISGEVTVKASQPGNADWDPAPDVFVSFQVLDPDEVLVEADILHPLSGDVHAPNLIPIQIAFTAGIDYPELFSVANVTALVEGETVTLTDHGNGHYTGWWTPTAYGNIDVEIEAENNFGVITTIPHAFNLIEMATNVMAMATDEAWVWADVPSVTVESELPSHIGAYDEIIGNLVIDCPTGGCDPWDRVSSVEVQGKNGEWFEIIRYLTPYGVACESEIDLTDFASLLSGKTKFRVNLGTQGNGFLYTLQLSYNAGVPDNAYSTVEKLWYQTYQFGDPANLQPTEHYNATFPEYTEAAKIKLVSSGHGWGENNSGNAAEFHADTHHIWVDDEETFEQYNWVDCNPNPDGCSPQNGTWQFNRAGWCPGSIAQFFDFDMSAFVSEENVDLKYIFDEDYVDLCHPNNPECISGSTCPNCDDGFNPHLIVSSYLISFGNSPLNNIALGDEAFESTDFAMYPNPSSGVFYVDVDPSKEISSIVVYDYLGRKLETISVNSTETSIMVSLRDKSSGIYMVSLYNTKGLVGTKKLIIE
ncbi:T9SS type A sorting domain-containing protein [Flavobacteriaceae bacterium TK19130]|nr:T9SS type A sorting domain-containing protein [Thermobacterium salinum]